ncbi:MAG TPA: hypothetical protein PKW71_13140 [Anaerohalosphaeraceae bacterium]|nr:hypothetical protein [Anaerohalosphaeraceae bacterium]
MWKGRFSEDTADVVLKFTQSLDMDWHLAEADIKGSKAHVKTLASAGLITQEEEKALLTKYQGNFYEIALGWDVRPKSYDERFGWRRFDTDGCLTIDDTLVIIEVKISKPGTEYGYWNAFSQGLIYSFQQKQDEPGKDFLVLCIILDWGRAAKRKLNECEKEILDLFRPHRIYFLRVSMADKPFIEHNLNTDWSVIA